MIVPDRVRVALVGASDDIRFLKLALEPSADYTTAFSIDEVSPARLGALNYSEYSAVLFAGLPQWNAEIGARVRSYLESGGGVVVFGSDGAAAYNAGAGAAGLPDATGRGDAPADRSAPFLFASFNRGHPLFRDVFERAPGVSEPAAPSLTESPLIASAIHFRTPPGAQELIRLSNGDPFVEELSVGAGKAILVAVPPTDAWSDLPLRPMFVPLVVRSALYAASVNAVGMSVVAGEPFALPLVGAAAVGTMMTIAGPGGSEERVKADAGGIRPELRVENDRRLGAYFVRGLSGRASSSFTANADGRASDLLPLETDSITAHLALLFAERARYSVVSNVELLGQSVVRARFGVELWQYCLLIVLLCAAAEMIIVKFAERRMSE
jgi:hypothetical protein